MDLGAPPVLPVLRLPEPPLLPRPVLEVPRATLPTYKPLVVPPSDLRPPPGVRGINSEEKSKEKPAPKPVPPPPPKPPPVPAQVRYVDIPGTDLTVPLPSNEILATANDSYCLRCSHPNSYRCIQTDSERLETSYQETTHP